MENLEKQKQLVAEAAESDFLWGLGMRVPSSNQARWVCKTLSLDVSDEKRVKAVMRLREENPEILSEISASATPPPKVTEVHGKAMEDKEETMVEVVRGEKQSEKIAEKKGRELWERVLSSVDIPTMEAVRDNFNKRNFKIYKEAEKNLPKIAGLFYERACSQDQSGGYIWHELVAIGHSFSPYNSYDRGIILNGPRSCPVKIRPTQYDNGRPEIRGAYIRQDHFYQPYSKSYSNVVVFVEDKSALPLAKRLAEAYERETKRRRKPAKAVVVKNY